MRYLGIGLVYAWRYTFGLLTPGRDVQVPPELLAVRDRRLPYPRARARARRSRPGGCFAVIPWSHGGVDYAEDAHFRRRKEERPA